MSKWEAERKPRQGARRRPEKAPRWCLLGPHSVTLEAVGDPCSVPNPWWLWNR